MGVRLQQCARPGGFWALFQITRAAPRRLGGQGLGGWEWRDWLRSSCHNAGIVRTGTRVVTMRNNRNNRISHPTGFREREGQRGT